MSHDHNNNGHSEKKSVAFGTPMILGIVTVFIILCFVSLGNPCHGKCCTGEECSKECAEACEKNDHSKHPGKHEENAEDKHGKEQENVSMPVSEEHATQEDSTVTKPAEPAKEETHH